MIMSIRRKTIGLVVNLLIVVAGCTPIPHSETSEARRGHIRWAYVDVAGNSFKGVAFVGDRPWLIASTNDGVLTLFGYDEGKNLEQVTLRNGLENGPFMQWGYDGSIKAEGNYVAGLKDGQWVRFGRDGSRQEEQWEMGKPPGRWIRWSGTQEVLQVSGIWPVGSERCETVRRSKISEIISETFYEHGCPLSHP